MLPCNLLCMFDKGTSTTLLHWLRAWLQGSTDSVVSASGRASPILEETAWESQRPVSTGLVGSSPFAAWSPAQPELPLPPGELANQRPPWQGSGRSPSGSLQKGASTIPAGRLLTSSNSILSSNEGVPTGRVVPTRRDREGETVHSLLYASLYH